MYRQSNQPISHIKPKYQQNCPDWVRQIALMETGNPPYFILKVLRVNGADIAILKTI